MDKDKVILWTNSWKEKDGTIIWRYSITEEILEDRHLIFSDQGIINMKELIKADTWGGKMYATVEGTKKAINLGYSQIMIDFSNLLGLNYWLTGQWKCLLGETRWYKDKMEKLTTQIKIIWKNICLDNMV